MRAFVERWVEDSYTEKEASIDREFLLLLDFIPENRDVKQTVRASYSGGVVGFYDRDSRELLVLSEDDGTLHPDTKRTFAHEIIHALQDHTFNLNSLYPDKWLRQDSLLARKALVEGDARYYEQWYAYELLPEEERNLLGTSTGSGGHREPIPYFYAWLGNFPYSSGPSFIYNILANLGLEELNRAYSNPPMSTEQILHPEKYLSGEAPIQVVLPDLTESLAEGWEVIDEEVIGELVLSMHLHTYLDFQGDRPSVAGWGGDSYALLRHSGNGETAIVSITAWDSVPLAQSFFGTYSDVAERSTHWRLIHSGESIRRWSGKGRTVHLEMDSNTVVLIIGNSQSTVETLSDAVRP